MVVFEISYNKLLRQRGGMSVGFWTAVLGSSFMLTTSQFYSYRFNLCLNLSLGSSPFYLQLSDASEVAFIPFTSSTGCKLVGRLSAGPRETGTTPKNLHW